MHNIFIILVVLFLFFTFPSKEAKALSYGKGVLVCFSQNKQQDYYLDTGCFARMSEWIKKPFNLYVSPNKKSAQTGILTYMRGEWSDIPVIHSYKRDVEYDIHLAEVMEISYEEKAPIVYRVGEDGWVLLSDGWLKLSKLEAKRKLRFMSWQEILNKQIEKDTTINDSSPFIGWFYPLVNQPLFASPNGNQISPASAMRAGTNGINRPDFLVIERNGNWLKVMLDYNSTVCSSENIKPNGPVGWIKMTEHQTGKPLIYWYTRGC